MNPTPKWTRLRDAYERVSAEERAGAQMDERSFWRRVCAILDSGEQRRKKQVRRFWL